MGEVVQLFRNKELRFPPVQPKLRVSECYSLEVNLSVLVALSKLGNGTKAMLESSSLPKAVAVLNSGKAFERSAAPELATRVAQYLKVLSGLLTELEPSPDFFC